MLYRNVKNGSVLDLTSAWGPNWEPLEEKKESKKPKTEKSKKKEVTKDE